jgi:hypothetical protein
MSTVKLGRTAISVVLSEAPRVRGHAELLSQSAICYIAATHSPGVA